MKESEVLAGEPINGHIVIKVDQSQVKKDLGLSEDSQLYIPQEKAFAGASSRGTVVMMATDAFGQVYQERYGKDINPPVIGDIVHFVPYQNAKLDENGEYYLITDDSVKFIERQSKEK